jgi:hypothetical protein
MPIGNQVVEEANHDHHHDVKHGSSKRGKAVGVTFSRITWNCQPMVAENCDDQDVDCCDKEACDGVGRALHKLR